MAAVSILKTPINKNVAATLNRVDRWLWTTRIFKTRALAVEACRRGRIKVGDVAVKPSRELQTGETVTVRDGPDSRTLVVRDFPILRVGAKLVADYLEDNTPLKPKLEQQIASGEAVWARERGAGRPTKRDRRRLVDTIDQP